MQNSHTSKLIIPRRKFLTLAAAGVVGTGVSLNYVAAMNTPGRMADELFKTPQMAEGPFYPDKLPLDTDNDLLVLNDALTPAVGEITVSYTHLPSPRDKRQSRMPSSA